jgi:hypothetical protein
MKKKSMGLFFFFF